MHLDLYLLGKRTKKRLSVFSLTNLILFVKDKLILELMPATNFNKKVTTE